VAEHRAYRYCPMCGTALEEIQRTGELRPVCPNCDYTVYYDPKVAVVMFVKHGDRVLLIRRGVDPQKGKWALPAGFVNAGEAPDAAALREIEEETGITLDRIHLLDVIANPGDGNADIVIAYGGETQNNQAHAGDDADEAAFFTLDELPETAFYTTTLLLGRWRNGDL
jgi:8-oxo-dGTP diphosphatase